MRRGETDVLLEVLQSFFAGPGTFSSDELMAEVEHYARIVGAEVPHPTAIGKRLAAMGYEKQGRPRSVDGKKVSVYRHALKAIKNRASF